MDKINLSVDYFEHPKTRRLVSVLGKFSEIYPIKLWIYCGKYFPDDGIFKGHSSEEIERIVGWSGDPGLAVMAMVNFGFLEKSESGYYLVHDWNKNQKVARTRNEKREESFKKPTPEEVREYALQNGYVVDQVAFWSYYEARGWVVGKTKMKNWRAAVSGWHHRSQKGGFNGVGNSQINRIGATPVPGKYANISS